jgi:hypothetical protein
MKIGVTTQIIEKRVRKVMSKTNQNKDMVRFIFQPTEDIAEKINILSKKTLVSKSTVINMLLENALKEIDVDKCSIKLTLDET